MKSSFSWQLTSTPFHVPMINDYDPVFYLMVPHAELSERLPVGGKKVSRMFQDQDSGVAGSFGSFEVHPIPPPGNF